MKGDPSGPEWAAQAASSGRTGLHHYCEIGGGEVGLFGWSTWGMNFKYLCSFGPRGDPVTGASTQKSHKVRT